MLKAVQSPLLEKEPLAMKTSKVQKGFLQAMYFPAADTDGIKCIGMSKGQTSLGAYWAARCHMF